MVIMEDKETVVVSNTKVVWFQFKTPNISNAQVVWFHFKTSNIEKLETLVS